jgi:serine phosphatase RsbU (regulator of sigma subunit)
VLIADDQPSVVDALVLLLKSRGIATDMSSTPTEVLSRLRERHYDLLLMDMNYNADTTSGAEGLHLVQTVRSLDPLLGIVVMTAWSTVEIAVAALQRGASDFIQKPWDNETVARVVDDQINATARRRREMAISQAEREQAKSVHRGLMGNSDLTLGPISITADSRSSRIVGGDYYDIREIGDSRISICVADAIGKGIGAGLLISNFQAQFRSALARSSRPNDVCAESNRRLRESHPESLITTFHGVIDTQTLTLAYSSAGHPPAFLLHTDGSIERLTTDDAIIGLSDDWEYRCAITRLRHGDRLLIVSDGFTDAVGATGEEAGDERVAEWFRAVADLDVEQAKQSMIAQLNEYTGGEMIDDATLLICVVA